MPARKLPWPRCKDIGYWVLRHPPAFFVHSRSFGTFYILPLNSLLSVGKSKERTTNTAQYPISNTFSPLSGWRRKFLFLVLALMIWAALSSAVFAICGTTLVNTATGSDTPGCGAAAGPCRTISWTRQRAQSCSVVTRIFTMRGNSMTLAEVVLPPSGSSDHNTPAWLRPIFPFFGILLNPSHYTTGIVDLSQ